MKYENNQLNRRPGSMLSSLWRDSEDNKFLALQGIKLWSLGHLSAELLDFLLTYIFPRHRNYRSFNLIWTWLWTEIATTCVIQPLPIRSGNHELIFYFVCNKSLSIQTWWEFHFKVAQRGLNLTTRKLAELQVFPQIPKMLQTFYFNSCATHFSVNI